VSELKTDELVRWRIECLGNAAFSQGTLITAAVRRLLEAPHSVPAQREMQDWLGKYRHIIGYDQAFLFDAKGVTRISVPGTEEPRLPFLQSARLPHCGWAQIILARFLSG